LPGGPDTLWITAYGGSDGEGGYSVHQTADDGYIIAGYTYSLSTTDDKDIFLI
jgi:hypothetical protein